MVFTFKKEPQETGLRAVGYIYPSTTIKYQRLKVGTIVSPCWQSKDRKWTIRFMVKKPSGNFDWGWTRINQSFDTEPGARKWIKANSDKILALGLHQMDEDK